MGNGLYGTMGNGPRWKGTELRTVVLLMLEELLIGHCQVRFQVRPFWHVFTRAETEICRCSHPMQYESDETKNFNKLLFVTFISLFIFIHLFFVLIVFSM